MVSDFVPLIGSGFDSLANQRLQWEQFNANIENQNIARAERAQQEEDNWLQQVAAMNQQREAQNFDRQMQADAFGRQLTLQNREEATRKQERAEDIARGTKQFQQQMDYGKNYLDQQQKIAEEKIAAAAKNKDLVLDSQGQHLAANYLGLQNTQEQTATALEDLRKKIDDVASQLDTERGKKKPDPNKIISLQNSQKLYNGQLRQRETDARAAENKLSALLNHAENAGFEINDDGTITHKESSKTWSWKNALKAAKQNVTAAAPIVAAPTDATDTSAALPWAGFAPNADTRVWDAGAQSDAALSPVSTEPPTAQPSAPSTPSGPGVLSRLQSAAMTVPPIAVTAAGLGNFVRPIAAGVEAGAPRVAEAGQQIGRGVGAAYGFSGPKIWAGFQNLVAPFGQAGRAALAGAQQPWLPGGAQVPPAPANPADRQVGKVYMTPTGAKQWQGTFWVDPT